MVTTLPTALPGSDADVLLWADPSEVEDAALQQLRNIAALPWVNRVRVMPDVHLGKGATVGSVIAMRDAVAPSAVGVDIGCGMIGVRTSLTADDLPEDLSALRLAIEAAVPVGWHQHDSHAPILDDNPRLAAQFDPLVRGFDELRAPKVGDRRQKMVAQCGTLGGGNHFIEVTLDDDDRVWLMLHSGSRNIGKEIAERHIATAKTLNHNLDLPDRDLAVFLADTDEMAAYLHDLYWAQAYAKTNREVTMALVRAVVVQHFPHVRFDEGVNCHHNYVSEETYDGVELVVTRKGAIRAATWGSSRAPWEQAPTWCVASATRSGSTPPRTAPDAGCPGGQRSARSPSMTSRRRPQASSAARTRVCSTRSPAPTRTSPRSLRRRLPASSRWSRWSRGCALSCA